MTGLRWDHGLTTPNAARNRPGRVGSVVGWVLVAAWVAWWAVSVHRDHLIFGSRTWVPPLAFLSGDFRVHIEPVARSQASGVDPYGRTDHWAFSVYPYPPMVARGFGWVGWVDPATAVHLWRFGLLACLVAGAWAAWRSRIEMGRGRWPFSLVLAVFLFSTPALFAMERGQSDPLVLPLLLGVAWCLRRRGVAVDLLAGAILGVAAWFKYYPGLMVVAPLALGRWRVVVAFVMVAGLIGIHDRVGFVRSVRNGQITARLMADKVRHIHTTKHSLVESWPAVGFVHRSRVLRSIPGSVAAAALLLPMVACVAWRVRRCGNDVDTRVTPLLLWLVSAATFAMPYSLDYNLTPLTLLVLCVASRDQTWKSHLVGLSFVAYSQPISVPLSGQTLLFVKLATLYAAGLLLFAPAHVQTDPSAWGQGIRRRLGDRVRSMTTRDRSTPV